MRTVSKKIRVALAGGGTGGHVYPIIAVAEALKRYAAEGYDVELHYFGEDTPLTKEVVARGAVLHRIAVGKWRKYFSLQNIWDVPKVFWSVIQSLWKLYFLMPDAVFSKGGPGALPVVWAAAFYRIPIIIHESDVHPGLTNLLSAPFARRIALGFPEAAKYFNPNKAVQTGNPVRQELAEQRTDPALAKERLGFDPERPLLLVTGGSQGAQLINDLIAVNLPQLLPMTQVYHQTGPANFAAYDHLAKTALMSIPVDVEAKSRYKYVPYLDEENGALALSAADAVVGRAGAAYISEFALFGKPAILIPLSGHQRENAYAFAGLGAARVIEEDNLNPSVFLSAVRQILEDPDTKAKMSAASLGSACPDAAAKIAAEVLGLAV